MTNAQDKLIPRSQDWIELFLEYTKDIPSPPLFRLWAAITAIGGTLERRVFVHSGGENLYPNLFVLFVAPPGVGKTQAIKRVNELWNRTEGLIVSPDNVTKAALVDALAAAKRVIMASPTEIIEYNSLQIAADELGVLIPAHDLEFLSHLNKIYDCPYSYIEHRRTIKDPIEIIKPQMSILAGTQPGFMAEVFPESAWGMGFTSRLIMLYSSRRMKIPLRLGHSAEEKAKEVAAQEALAKTLVSHMNTMVKLRGGFHFTEESAIAIQTWDAEVNEKTKPEHSKLEHYNARRIMHILKLCMVASVSRSNSLLITIEDFQRALAWLLEAEATMPDVFRNMAQKSDANVIQELHFYCWQVYSKEKAPIHEQRLYNFLSTKVPSDRIEKILEIADRAGIVERVAGSTNKWKPAPTQAQGLE